MTRPNPDPGRRPLATGAWVIGGVLLYAMCINMFGGYPRLHSEALTLVGVATLVVLGALVWYRDEHRGDQS